MRVPYTPRPYAPLMTNFIRDRKRGRLFADMGLGKSVCTLTALEQLHFMGEIDHPVLIVAPLRVAQSVWPEEIQKWEHLKDVLCFPILGTAAQRLEVLRRYLPRQGKSREPRLQVYTINFENVPWLVKELGDRWPFKTIIADEDTKLKGYRTRQGTARAKALASIAWSRVDRFFGLSGTPAPNGVIDLWGPQWFIDRGAALGSSFSKFEERWFHKGHDGFSIKPHAHSQKEIEERIAPTCLSLNASDWLDVAKPVINNIYVDLPATAMETYKKFEREMYIELREEEKLHKIEAVSAGALSMKCLQIANGAMYVGGNNEEWVEVHDAKIEALRDVVEEAAGMPVLVAYHFKSDVARLRAAFPRGRVLDKSPQTILDWNAGKVPVLFAHPASAGHGLNLQYGSHIAAVFGHWWDMEQYLQFIERIGPVRQMQAGFNRPVYIHRIISRGTVDELVIQRLESKRTVQDILLEAMKQRS